MTPLARAHAAMEAAPDDDALRLAFFHEVAASELHVLGGETPQVFDTSDGPVILAFDDEEALADFARAPVDRATLPGRALVQALKGQGVGLTLHTGGGETLLNEATLDWLATHLAFPIETTDARLGQPEAPRALDPALLDGLERAFQRMAGMARVAWLFETGEGLVLGLEGAAEASEGALSRSIAEAVRFSDWDGRLDVTFLDAAQAERLKGRAVRIDLPEPPTPPERPKDQPPKLR